MNENIIVAFDVDGTLINLDRTPNYEVVALYKKFESLGCRMVVWSGGGQDYASGWSEKLGLYPEFALPKGKFNIGGKVRPDIAFDDEEVMLGEVNIRVKDVD